MRVKAIKTRILKPPKDDIFSVIFSRIKRFPEISVLAIASKAVSIHQGQCVLKSTIKNKDALIQKEADRYIPRNRVPKGYAVLTVKNNILIPSAGIDASNAGNYYVLWPRQPQKTAEEFYRFLKRTYKVKKIGVIIVDSYTAPMRRGVLGVAVGYYGFKPINDYRGTKDLFGRKFEMSTANVADALATAAVVTMGEGAERTPLALISDIPFVQFTSKSYKPKKRIDSFHIQWDEDLYGPLLKAVKWKLK